MTPPVQVPRSASWVGWLIFTAIAAALSAYVSYVVTNKLKENE